ncbi:MAG TPA: arylamine N-acetyltransferase [Solirubrobacteraceae bacterium]|jgi:N-hydroxyarylamine O-acetyltransferase|nr:arylamine N-acetyltransferase [Solirubrobacteraceae bacterium]
MLDLDAYLERIGLNGRPSIAQVHRAHLTSIPFENLDPHQGLPVSLEVEDLERKLVTERRGGYCFEQNLLLKAALEALGAEVDMFLARMRLPNPRDTRASPLRPAKPGVVRPRSHLLLRVSEHSASWHADVGFPRGILEPIPFGLGPTQEQSGWSFRVVEDGSELVLQKLAGDEWTDVYGFVPQPVPLIDVETSNWWTSTHPRSLFVTGLIVGVRGDDGTGTLLCDWSELSLSEQTPAGTRVTPLEREATPELLATRFSLPGFALGADERLVRVAAP